MIHIGVLSPVTGGFYFGDVLAGVVREVAAAGGRVTLVQTLDAGNSGDELVPAPDVHIPVGWDRLDGFVSVAQAASEGYLRRLRESGKPLVLASNAIPVDAASVVADNREGVLAAVAHLVGHGHTRIAFTGNLAQTDMRERYDAYCAGMAAHGLTTDEVLFVPTVDHVEIGGRRAAAAVAALVRAAEPVTAVVTSTDRIALGLMAVLESEHGLQVPQDLAVIGFDDVEAGWRSSPPLATVNQRIQDIGAQAARLLLAEIAGEPVEHRRHVVPSTFLPRRSCGCLAAQTSRAVGGEAEGAALATALLALRLTDPVGPAGTAESDEQLALIDAVIGEHLRAYHAHHSSPEAMERFTETVVEHLGRRSLDLVAAGLPGAKALSRCLARLTVTLSQQGAIVGLARSDGLAVSMGRQYEVGMGLLGRVGTDPSDLSWLSTVEVPLGCLGLWDGPPEEGRLRIAGVYDPHGHVPGALGQVCRVEEFPPREVVDHADPSRDEVTFVIPLRGASGDHGLLCIEGTVDTQAGTGRATYNHWAALLGVALKQQRLLEDVRGSEERYSLAAAATQDGLWDWDVAAGTCFWSDRCVDMLDAPVPDAPPAAASPAELAPWTGRVHPEDAGPLLEQLRQAVRTQQPFEIEHRIRAADGTDRWVLCRALPVGEPGQEARRVVGSLSDIHPRKELEDQLRQAALYDAVTGLPNRRLFLDRLRAAVARSADGPDGPGVPFAVVFLDLDGFKLVNDSLGHLAGDDLLRTVAQRLQDELRTIDVAARFGGDEFAVLLTGLQPGFVMPIVDRIQQRIAAAIPLGSHEVAVSASVGVATSGAGYTDAEDVLRDADIAMYNAKESERGTASVFDPAMHTRASGRLLAQSELRAALAERQFVVHYQPMVDLDGSDVTRFEALVRWEHPERGSLLPAGFLPLMAETGTIVALGQWIIATVCAQVGRWRETYHGPVTVSVNLSHREFWSEALLPTVTHALAQHGVPASCLVLEITESVIMADSEAARRIMSDLRAAGIRLHVDDFGTGQSSLHALRAFPVDALKIDQSFVQLLGVDTQTTELVRVILAMGRALGIGVVAEGVETVEQAEHLRMLGCDTVQGWLFAGAVPGDTAGAMLGGPLAVAAAAGPVWAG